ncbi:Glycosyltransferase Family 8 protein [Rhizophagus diaphanus]|nr:Glycosyltransferase Family 8 protein [Rhizophagus diaphanus] [Rhizophagus sp. MUCL 43196]
MAEKKAWCLARSLKRVQTVYPLIVLHPDTSINISTGQPKEKTSLTAEDLESIKNEGYCWTKLRVWDIEGYDRDFLGAVNACTCNPRKRQNYPKDWIPSSCSYTLGPIKPESEDTPGKKKFRWWKVYKGIEFRIGDD